MARTLAARMGSVRCPPCPVKEFGAGYMMGPGMRCPLHRATILAYWFRQWMEWNQPLSTPSQSLRPFRGHTDLGAIHLSGSYVRSNR